MRRRLPKCESVPRFGLRMSGDFEGDRVSTNCHLQVYTVQPSESVAGAEEEVVYSLYPIDSNSVIMKELCLLIWRILAHHFLVGSNHFIIAAIHLINREIANR